MTNSVHKQVDHQVYRQTYDRANRLVSEQVRGQVEQQVSGPLVREEVWWQICQQLRSQFTRAA